MRHFKLSSKLSNILPPLIKNPHTPLEFAPPETLLSCSITSPQPTPLLSTALCKVSSQTTQQTSWHPDMVHPIICITAVKLLHFTNFSNSFFHNCLCWQNSSLLMYHWKTFYSTWANTTTLTLNCHGFHPSQPGITGPAKLHKTIGLLPIWSTCPSLLGLYIFPPIFWFVVCSLSWQCSFAIPGP